MSAHKAPRLRELLFKKRTLFSSLHNGWLLDLAIDDRCFTYLETLAANPSADSLLEEIREALTQVTGPEDADKLGAFLDKYAEALVFWRVHLKCPDVERIPEKKNIKTPDFRVPLNGTDYFLEVKSPRIVSNDPCLPKGTTAHEQMVLDSLANGFELDKVAKKPGAFFSEQIINPYQPSTNSATPPTRQLNKVERLDLFTDKVAGMIKMGQLAQGPTVVVIVPFRLPLDCFTGSCLVPAYFDQAARACDSGEGWYVACGVSGDLILEAPSCPADKSLSGRLKKDGVLQRFQNLQGVGFLQSSLNDDPYLSLLYRTESSLEQLANRISDASNDTDNSNGWKYQVRS